MNFGELKIDIQPVGKRFDRRMANSGWERLTRDRITTLQINLGRLCNQACHHCHVEAGPKRTEIMEAPVVDRLISLAAHPDISTVDLTGGAPEMNPHFRRIVSSVTETGRDVIVRCNLTIIEEAGYDWLPEFYADNNVRLVCSLPCYGVENVTQQRGQGVFEKSIAALKKLNAVGYGQPNSIKNLCLDLVYNPNGASLPPSQVSLEADYKRELSAQFGVTFNNLLTLTNLPVGRFSQTLRRKGELEPYMALLDGAFNPSTLARLMCRNTLNVGWDGKIYDCDFNQMLNMEIDGSDTRLLDPDFSLAQLRDVPIRTGDHCLGCTAGSGSSCGGALTG